MADLDLDNLDETTEDVLRMFTGESINVDSIVDDMFKYYKSQFEDNNSPISYLEEGGEARNILEAFAYVIFSYFYFLNEGVLMYFLPYAKGDFLDILGRDNPRNTGKQSTGELEYYLPDDIVKDYDITIPAYSVAITEDEESLEFETIEDKILPARENSVLIPARSIYGGSEYNVEKNRVTILEDDIDELEVRNPLPFNNGTADEDDESYRARLLEAKKSINFGSIAWYQDTAEKLDDVHDVSINNCSSGNYTIEMVVNPPSDDVIDFVTRFFNDPVNIPAGITTYVSAANQKVVDLRIENVVFANNVNPEDGITMIGSRISEFFKNLRIGDDLQRNEILTVLSKIEGLIGYTLLEPIVDLTSDERSVFVLGELEINE